jgi:hypothetical protein
MTIRRFYNSQRMQTNAAWNSLFQFVVGNPPIPFSLATWTLKGNAKRVNLPSKSIDLDTKLVLMDDDTSKLLISLTEDDTNLLGVGKIVFEILRIDPAPQRPIVKFYIENHAGVV